MTQPATLEIRGLEASVEGKPILKGIDLDRAARARPTRSWARTARASRRWRTC